MRAYYLADRATGITTYIGDHASYNDAVDYVVTTLGPSAWSRHYRITSVRG